MERKVYRSRISVALMGFILAVMLPSFIPIISSGDISNPAFYHLAGVIVFIVLIFCGIRYEITEKYIAFKMWFFSTKVPLSKIVSVERSYNPLASGAASLKRLCVRFKKGYKYPFTFISPVREQEFLETLKTLNPYIQINVSDKQGWWRFWDWDI